jgi:hypothetical protein
MEHVSYGLFDNANDARAAIDAIEVSGTPRQRIGVTLHKDRLDQGLLGPAETDASEGRRDGAAIAGILGAITGAVVMGPIGLMSGGALGALYGGLAGALAGSGAPDRNLDAALQASCRGQGPRRRGGSEHGVP